MRENDDLALLTDKVRKLAIETGAFIRNERKKFLRERVEKKHAHDYVSYVDKNRKKELWHFWQNFCQRLAL